MLRIISFFCCEKATVALYFVRIRTGSGVTTSKFSVRFFTSKHLICCLFEVTNQKNKAKTQWGREQVEQDHTTWSPLLLGDVVGMCSHKDGARAAFIHKVLSHHISFSGRKLNLFCYSHRLEYFGDCINLIPKQDRSKDSIWLTEWLWWAKN